MSSSASTSFHSAYETTSSPKQPGIPHPVYRLVKILPYELCEHCRIYFEETLCMVDSVQRNRPANNELDTQALNLLISLLTSGATSNPPVPAFLATHQYLALAATLVVHPSLTTRAKSEKLIKESNLALQYLRSTLDTVGPINGNLRDAFLFTGLGTSSRRGGSGRKRVFENDESPLIDNSNTIENDLAQSGSIWARAEDFWQVVGWAFNCSILHKKRWTRWSLWLDYMLDVLERDWGIRALGLQGECATSEHEDPRQASMIVGFLGSTGASTGREKKILRAVFANGESRAAAEFPEIWKNESKERKNADVQKIQTKIDIEADDYGDYMSADESDLEEGNPRIKDPLSSQAESQNSESMLANLATPLGGTDAINLRVRILSLLSTVSADLPDAFVPLNTLYDIYLQHIRPLPLPTFFLVLSPSTLSVFPPFATSSLVQYILRSLIESAAPLPLIDDLTQPMLEKSFLPYAANTTSIADNAKVSLCVETLLRLLDQHVGLKWSPNLQDAMERGVEARDRKASKKGKKRVRDEGADDEKIWLQASAARIKAIVNVTKP